MVKMKEGANMIKREGCFFSLQRVGVGVSKPCPYLNVEKIRYNEPEYKDEEIQCCRKTGASGIDISSHCPLNPEQHEKICQFLYGKSSKTDPQKITLIKGAEQVEGIDNGEA